MFEDSNFRPLQNQAGRRLLFAADSRTYRGRAVGVPHVCLLRPAREPPPFAKQNAPFHLAGILL